MQFFLFRYAAYSTANVAAPVAARPTAHLVRFVRVCGVCGLVLVDDFADVFNFFGVLEGRVLRLSEDCDMFFGGAWDDSWYRKGGIP